MVEARLKATNLLLDLLKLLSEGGLIFELLNLLKFDNHDSVTGMYGFTSFSWSSSHSLTRWSAVPGLQMPTEF